MNSPKYGEDSGSVTLLYIRNSALAVELRLVTRSANQFATRSDLAKRGGSQPKLPPINPVRSIDIKMRAALMKSMLLGAFIALLTCCRGYAEFHGYYFTPSDAGSSFETTYKFHVEGMKGYVTSAELFVSPAARPIWNNNLNLWGSESTAPLLSDRSDRTTYIGRG